MMRPSVSKLTSINPFVSYTNGFILLLYDNTPKSSSPHVACT